MDAPSQLHHSGKDTNLLQRRNATFKKANRQHALIMVFVNAKIPLSANWKEIADISFKSLENIKAMPGEGFGKGCMIVEKANADALRHAIRMQRRILLYKAVLQDALLLQAICDNDQVRTEEILKVSRFLCLMPCDTTQKLQDIYMSLSARLDQHNNRHRLKASSHAAVACQGVAVSTASLQTFNQIPTDTTLPTLPFFKEEEWPFAKDPKRFLDRCAKYYDQKLPMD